MNKVINKIIFVIFFYSAVMLYVWGKTKTTFF